MSSSKRQAKLAKAAKRDVAAAVDRGQDPASSSLLASTVFRQHNYNYNPALLGDVRLSDVQRTHEALKAAYLAASDELDALQRECGPGAHPYALPATPAALAKALEIDAALGAALCEFKAAAVCLPPGTAIVGGNAAVLRMRINVRRELSEHLLPGGVPVHDEAIVTLVSELLPLAKVKEAGLFEPKPPAAATTADKVDLLRWRGEALTRLGRYGDAIEDLSSAAQVGYAELDMATPTPYETDNQAGKQQNPCVEPCLVAMALQKQQEGAPRPHYDGDRKRAIERMFRLGKDFCDQLRQCNGCGAVPTATNGVALKACSQCQGPRYCGKECQRKAWRDGHKADCKKDDSSAVVMLDDDDYASVKEECELGGYYIITHRTGPSVVLRDRGTGELFESLTNKAVLKFGVVKSMLGAMDLSGASPNVREALEHAMGGRGN